ncbi:hypothetical protein [Pedobacter miscanthi]|uniref:hypothetical protein n=1 Tax=Pedobacter miscanthi TaxID=2259170 RepID=UPI00292D47E1|nr:hypothetical protein [Pedobacter miscanthi]
MKFSIKEIFELKDEINELLAFNGANMHLEIDCNYGVMTIKEVTTSSQKTAILQYAKGDNASRFLMGYRYALQLKYNQNFQFSKENWLARVLKNRPVY